MEERENERNIDREEITEVHRWRRKWRKKKSSKRQEG